MKAAWTGIVSLTLVGCTGSTGSSLFDFEASATGATGGSAGAPTFETPRGFEVTLTKARFRIGAVYLLASTPVSGAGDTDCIVPAAEDALVYVGEVTRGAVVDALDPSPQPFPGVGEAIGQRAAIGQVWLFAGDVDDLGDDPVVLDVAGTARRDGEAFPFEGQVTIGRNRLPPIANPAAPSAHPICKERIVSGIEAGFRPEPGGRLGLRIHPEGLFTNVDFGALARASQSPPLYRFRDDGDDAPSLNLYRGLQARTGVYELIWQDEHD